MITLRRHVNICDSEVIVSVGYFHGTDIPIISKTNPKYVLAYDPLPVVYKEYEKYSKEYEWFTGSDSAVGGHERYSYFDEWRTKSHLTTKEVGRKVKVISMAGILSSVFERYGEIDKLLLNCEGSEIEIIKSTSIEIFCLCKFIFVQFHSFVPDFCIEKEEVKECIDKLSEYFNVYNKGRKYEEYIMVRKP